MNRPARTLAPTMLVLLAGLATAAGCSARTSPGNDPPSVAKAEELREDLRALITSAKDKVFPALVNIRVITANYYGGKETKGGSTGSGTTIGVASTTGISIGASVGATSGSGSAASSSRLITSTR